MEFASAPFLTVPDPLATGGYAVEVVVARFFIEGAATAESVNSDGPADSFVS